MNGEQALFEIHEDIKSLRKDVSDVMMKGCAKREGDLQRVKNVEKSLDGLGRKMDLIVYASFVTAGGIIVFLIKALWPYIIKI
jgi:uncharacterized protein Yka (UPF0111/DUF47 family)